VKTVKTERYVEEKGQEEKEKERDRDRDRERERERERCSDREIDRTS